MVKPCKIDAICTTTTTEEEEEEEKKTNRYDMRVLKLCNLDVIRTCTYRMKETHT